MRNAIPVKQAVKPPRAGGMMKSSKDERGSSMGSVEENKEIDEDEQYMGRERERTPSPSSSVDDFLNVKVTEMDFGAAERLFRSQVKDFIYWGNPSTTISVILVVSWLYYMTSGPLGYGLAFLAVSMSIIKALVLMGVRNFVKHGSASPYKVLKMSSKIMSPALRKMEEIKLVPSPDKMSNIARGVGGVIHTEYLTYENAFLEAAQGTGNKARKLQTQILVGLVSYMIVTSLFSLYDLAYFVFMGFTIAPTVYLKQKHNIDPQWKKVAAMAEIYLEKASKAAFKYYAKVEEKIYGIIGLSK